jgi:hypothetical protein
MIGYIRQRKLRALITQPSDELLAEFIACFVAGYRRGLNDVQSQVPADLWIELISSSSIQLSRDRSPAEAGCWLAGVISGREAAADTSFEYHDERVRAAYFAALASGRIEECAHQSFVTTFRRKRGPVDLLLEINEVAAAS